MSAKNVRSQADCSGSLPRSLIVRAGCALWAFLAFLVEHDVTVFSTLITPSFLLKNYCPQASDLLNRNLGLYSVMEVILKMKIYLSPKEGF